MVQVKIAMTVSENITENLNKNVETTTEILDHLHELKERERNSDWPDSTHLILNVMQELLTTLPQLSLEENSGDFFAQHTGNVRFENKIEKNYIAEDLFSTRGRLEKFLPRSLILHDSRQDGVAVRSAADNSIPMPTTLINHKIERGANESFQRSYGSEKEAVSVADNANAAQSSLLPASLQAQLAEPPITLKREDATALRSMPFGENTTTSDSFLESGLRYSFHSWGKQHMVQIMIAPSANLQSSLSYPSLALQPSSSLVEQRLQAYDGMTDHGDRWVLTEHGNDQRQQQHADHRRREKIEDDI